MSTQTKICCRLAALASGVAAMALAAPATAGGKATLSYSVDGGPAQSIAIVGVDLPNGKQGFNHTVAVPASDIVISWNYSLDPDPEDAAYYTGSTAITNNAGVSRHVYTTIEFNICPSVSGGSVIGGTAAVKANTNANGGGISCTGDGVLYAVTTDGDITHTIFYCPFNMATTGAGSLTTNASFGLPIPSLPGPTKVGSIGVLVSAVITDGDKGTFSGLFAVEPVRSGGVAGGCEGDLNGDDTVDGVDLNLLFLQWGPSGGCGAADLDADGIVGPTDMSLLLNSWGPCSR